MKITKKQFLADVMHEIEMLKKHATKKEKEALNFATFDPFYENNCIYGQLTGNCRSERSKKLMDLACKRVMNLDNGANELLNQSFIKIVSKINGEYTGQTWIEKYEGDGYAYRNWSYLSALEGYINLSKAKNKQIIAYIKGEIDTLKL